MKTQIIKFRLAPIDKARLMRIASERRSTVSGLLRRAAHLVCYGRVDDVSLRADMVEVRRVANAISAIADRFNKGDQTAASDAYEAAQSLRRVAEVHLSNAS